MLDALTLNREPGWHFAGHFFDVSFDEMGAGDVSLSILPDAHCELDDGQAHALVGSTMAPELPGNGTFDAQKRRRIFRLGKATRSGVLHGREYSRRVTGG